MDSLPEGGLLGAGRQNGGDFVVKRLQGRERIQHLPDYPGWRMRGTRANETSLRFHGGFLI